MFPLADDVPPLATERLRRWQFVVLTLMVVGYAGCYLCRSNFSVCLNLIVDSLVEQGYTADVAREWLGWVASLGTLTYALGKFVTGSIADMLGGRRNVLSGMLGSVLFTFLFVMGGTLPIFTMAWIGNRLVQSLCWAGMVKLTGRWFSYSAYGSAMGIISLSYLFGDAVARSFMGFLLTHSQFGWREVFWVAGGCLLLLTVLDWFWLKESPLVVGLDEPAANPIHLIADAAASNEPVTVRALVVPLLTSPMFLIVCVLSLGLTLLRETFGIWSPAYFADVIGSTTAQAAHQSALFPLLGGASVLLAGWLGDRLGQGGRATVILAGCLGTAAVLGMLAYGRFEMGSWTPVGLVGLVGFMMLGPYSFLAGAISLDLGGKRAAATACGIIDGVGYLGAILAGGAVARLSVDYGWPGAFKALAVVALLTALAAGIFLRMQRREIT